jgi:hypothetical protein
MDRRGAVAGRNRQSNARIGFLLGGRLRLEHRLDRRPQHCRSQTASRESQLHDTDEYEEGSPVMAIARHRTAPVYCALRSEANLQNGQKCPNCSDSTLSSRVARSPCPAVTRREVRFSTRQSVDRAINSGLEWARRMRKKGTGCGHERRDHLPQVAEIDKLKSVL